jgi:hypothetical protein
LEIALPVADSKRLRLADTILAQRAYPASSIFFLHRRIFFCLRVASQAFSSGLVPWWEQEWLYLDVVDPIAFP